MQNKLLNQVLPHDLKMLIIMMIKMNIEVVDEGETGF